MYRYVGDSAISDEQGPSSDFQTSPPWEKCPSPTYSSSPELPSPFLTRKRRYTFQVYDCVLPGEGEKEEVPPTKQKRLFSTENEQNPGSPISPSPEPLSPVLEKRKYESTTYRLARSPPRGGRHIIILIAVNITPHAYMFHQQNVCSPKSSFGIPIMFHPV